MTSEDRLEQIHQRLAPLRSALLEHPLYGQIQTLDELHVFMRHHAFAVWDFMSLLKALQKRICGVDVPWHPPADPAAARFVNEIVLGEESDDRPEGGYASHFELYHRAMNRAGADTGQIDRFLSVLKTKVDRDSALEESQAPPAVQSFVGQTFKVIERGDLCEIAAAFTFGREELLPGVFQRIVELLNRQSEGRLDDFLYYLNRHIEVDEEQHGPMAARLIRSLCQDDAEKWRKAETAAVASLQARITLWDGIHQALLEPADSNAPA